MQIKEWPAVLYAIGDIHGCAAQLQRLNDKIVADAEAIEGQKLIVCVGDYVDRGGNSAAVLDLLLSPLPPGFSRICLAGNHEVMMLEHFANPRANDRWLGLGGVETLLSYGIDASTYKSATPRERAAILRSHVPDRHLDFMSGLPILLSLPGLVLAHAGIRAGVPLLEQSEEDLLWMRDQSEAEMAIARTGPLVIHGHTPAPEPTIFDRNIGIDTGAFATGILTAIRLKPGEAPYFLSVGTETGR